MVAPVFEGTTVLALETRYVLREGTPFAVVGSACLTSNGHGRDGLGVEFGFDVELIVTIVAPLALVALYCSSTCRHGLAHWRFLARGIHLSFIAGGGFIHLCGLYVEHMLLYVEHMSLGVAYVAVYGAYVARYLHVVIVPM